MDSTVIRRVINLEFGLNKIDRDIDAMIETYGHVEIRFRDTLAPLPTSARPAFLDTEEQSSED
jgi:hypothetical protein